MRLPLSAILAVLAWAAPAAAEAQPKAVPLTRDEMKKALDALKKRAPRLPLPGPPKEEKPGGRRLVNNGRMRACYLPAEFRGDFRRGPSDPNLSLDHATRTMFFWIVSRANNCFY
jgi:hypothetical protein